MVEMKTIILVSNISSGLMNFRYELIENLVQKYKVVILALDTGRVDECIKMGCEFHNLKMYTRGTNFLSELSLIRKYKKEIKKINPDIVLTYTIKPNIYAGMACASLGIPYIANITGLGSAVENGGLLQKITIPLYRFGIRKAKKVFFQNKDNMDFMIKERIVSGAYDLIPGSGVNIDRYALLEYPHEATIDFVFIGRIMKEKGIDQFIDLAKVIRVRHPESRFHICGKCTLKYESILNELNDNGTIIYHGKVDNIVEIHRMSSCTIHPTYYPEGMSNVLLESCSCGRPIITTDRPGCREVVEDGVNGFLIKPKDSDDLIEKVETFLNMSWEERRKMGIEGREKVVREFDRKIVVNKYLEEIGE